ncbi:MAG: single-stranded DNA-binding protein [Clostridia bacterium]|nr:single-stranded DNA-binding protein [Clostridia bacterium]
MVFNIFYNVAVKETNHLHNNEIFTIKDLFKGYEWKRISKNDRLLLGSLFLKYVQTSVTHFEPIEKTSSGQQKYKVKNDL